ncbi:MAG: DegT/DnrJ/EryC1/StrS family aminotransferase [Bacteroidales bacterium]|jgi:perosamine synthetase|nr:DegT/DnrJ/EryC1/StrS family aminotransferase [Bacteroidales bacterium]
MNIRLFKPSLGKEELENIKESFDRSWVGLGPNVNEFEKKWAEFLGCKEAIGVNSATASLHIALMVFGFPEGKKVLVPSLTFASTATAILYNKLIPVFVDSNPITLGMDLEDMKRKYDEDVVAIMPVHFAGHPAPMDELMPWAREKGLKVIEDCAHTSGALYKGKALGTWGDIGCFSFEEKKLMTTGDGGMIVSNDPELLKDVKAYRWVGIDKDNWKTAQAYTDTNKDAMHWFYEINLLGFKYNMNDLAAAIGLAQLQKLPKMNARRSEIIRMYLNGIKDIKGIKPLLPFEPEQYMYQMFGVRAENRDELMIYLKSKGIATGCHYTPLSLQPLFKPFAENCDYIEKEANKFITLPLHADLTNKEVEYVIKHIKSFK